jgi:hypothetical protein
LTGHAYDIEVTRVLNKVRNIDYVFGVEIPCISELRVLEDLSQKLNSINSICYGTAGILINRCFGDLVSAMKNADDTAFYCYRAIESLRHHCASLNGLTNSKKEIQWSKFREVAKCEKQAIMDIKAAADPLRHGGITPVSSEDRAALFRKTWSIVEGYIEHCMARTNRGCPDPIPAEKSTDMDEN